MPEDEASAGRAWLLEPLGPEEVRIHIDLGDGAQISEEGRAALDVLLDDLYGDEVSGFTGTFPKCGSLTGCTGFSCSSLNGCQPLSKTLCFSDVRCNIQK